MWRPDLQSTRGWRTAAGLLPVALAVGWAAGAGALLPRWLQHAVSGTAVEAALFREMPLPGVEVLYPRPPAESVGELTKLVDSAPEQAALLSLRAHQEESALDFAAAERDWKAYAAEAPDAGAASMDLAEFYGRRLAVQDEFATLLAVGALPPGASDAVTAPAAQRSWKAFERALTVAARQSFAPPAVEPLWQGWMARYPRQRTVYARAFTWELNHGRTGEAQAVLERFRTVFPDDAVLPVKAEASLAMANGGPDGQLRALAVYDKGFTPLWPADLTNSYFDLLAATHSTRRFLAEAQARLARNPDDLNAAARLFAYDRHNGHPEAGLAVLAAFRASKEQRDPSGGNWTPNDLNTLERMTAAAQAYPEAARYAYALYHLKGKLTDGRPAQEAGLSAMVGLLLDAPGQPLPLGAGNLSMYRDIATLDPGPGYWNGVLSLWLNDQDVANQFAQVEAKAQPYFHRAEAAVLLKLLDTEAPDDRQRAALHAKLIEAYAGYGEDAAVAQAGAAFLQTFPKARDRVQVALAMADAEARRKDANAEFAVYDSLLQELGKETGNLPLSTARMVEGPGRAAPASSGALDGEQAADGQPGAEDSSDLPEAATESRPNASRALALDTGPPAPEPNPAATAYAEVLDRYLGRLTAMHELPEALGVLRKEVDRNPNDPGLYERLATFLSQNNLSAQQEEVFRAAIARFNDKSWYDKLARFYLREKRFQEFAGLTRQVTDIFSGTELESYFSQVRGGGPVLALQLNLYAHKRFPHDLAFTQNMLAAYRAGPTADNAAWEKLLRETWWQSPQLTNEFFAFLSRTGKLQAELAALPSVPESGANPAALQERAEAALWASHFEASAPLFDELARLYPADPTVGTTAADLNRSLAWLRPAGPAPEIAKAVAIEERLLSTNPGDLNRLARLGDILSDHADGTPASYRAASAFWRRMPGTAPGVPETYLEAATVFWDYFQFDDALREIREARAHFNDPVLYGYEAGAILEGRRDFPAAVREYTAAALGGPAATGTTAVADRRVAVNLGNEPVDLAGGTNPSAERLLQLARRPGTAALVDRATAAQMDHNDSLAALQLRVEVLHAEHLGSQAAPLVMTAVRNASTADAEAELATYAQNLGDGPAREAALAREAELTPDSSEKLALRYQLTQLYEARNDLPDAQRIVEESYRENPLILGVVRSTVDFGWRNGRQKQAVDVLVDAARAARPPLAQQFTAEAAEKANGSGDTARGRELARSLLASDPYSAQYVSLVAESYARAGDLAGLQGFYRAQLETVRTAPMSAEDRRSRTALLRKGLIPALAQASDYGGAVDQYIALVSAYPEDSGLIREAALFAAAHDQQQKLLGFFQATVGSSPRDPRYFVALAQTEAIFGDASAALEAYTHAVALRPERSDLFIAKAALEERLGRYDAAVADYDRLFQLSYKDPQWMVAAAKAQARGGHNQEAVKALETAYLHGAQSTPHDQFLVAAQLAEWNMLTEAQSFAEGGAAAAGDDLLAGDAPRVAPEDAAIYARVLTRARATAEAFQTLRAALVGASATSPSSPGTIEAQVHSQGLASVTDAEWRKSFARARREKASAQFNSALNAMGETVATYGTPEEHATFSAALRTQRGTADRGEVIARWIPAAHAAGLGALEASWRAGVLMSASDEDASQLMPFVQLEKERLDFAELGRALEKFVETHPKAQDRAQAWNEAVDAYGAAGDVDAQLRVLRAGWTGERSGAGSPEPYLRLIAQKAPELLVSLTRSEQRNLANAATEAALDAPSPGLALRAVQARGASLGPLWTLNYTALGGLYAHADPATVRSAFDDSLGLGATIAERVEPGSSGAQRLAGKPWFYLAGRYGQWLLANPAGSVPAEDVLPADLEAGGNAAAYLTLAQTEAEGGRSEAALFDAGHALELAPGSVAAYDMQATLLWRLGRRQEAIEAWSKALDALRRVEQRGPAPESLWTDFARIAFRAHEHRLYAPLKPAMDATLRSYLGHNGTYRSADLLEAAYEASPGPAEGIGWLISLASAAKDPDAVLGSVENAQWMPAAGRETVLEHELALLPSSVMSGTDVTGEPWRVAGVRSRLLRLYLRRGEGAKALALLQMESAAERSTGPAEKAEMVAAAETGGLRSLLGRFEAQPDKAPAGQIVKEAAKTLERDGQATSARSLLEWNLQRAEKAPPVASSDYLAVAEARLQTGDTAGAVALLGTMVAASDDLDNDREAAAALLEANGHASEAVPFLAALAGSVPWNLSYGVRLAEAQIAAGTASAGAAETLAAAARNPAAPYALRARAAGDLGHMHRASPALGAAELELLASGRLSPAAARQPFFVAARAVAASEATVPKVGAALLREALSIAPYATDAQTLRQQAFEAEEHAGDFAGAKAALASLLSGQNRSFGMPAPYGEDSGSTDSDAVYGGAYTPLPQELDSASPERRAHFAREVATVYAATGDPAMARGYLLDAMHWDPGGAEASAARGQLAALDAEQRLAAANAARRPRIANQLDQITIVRARLTQPPDVPRSGTEVSDE